MAFIRDAVSSKLYIYLVEIIIRKHLFGDLRYYAKILVVLKTERALKYLRNSL